MIILGIVIFEIWEELGQILLETRIASQLDQFYSNFNILFPPLLPPRNFPPQVGKQRGNHVFLPGPECQKACILLPPLETAGQQLILSEYPCINQGSIKKENQQEIHDTCQDIYYKTLAYTLVGLQGRYEISWTDCQVKLELSA